MPDRNLWCVILAGGSGTRFWPISTAKVPKQFLPVGESGKIFIQATKSRFDGLVPPERIIVVTNRKFGEMVRGNLPDIPSENILEEPYNRDTAPAVAYAMYTILKRDPEAIMTVVPCDHMIADQEKFKSIIRFVANDLHQYDALVTIGIAPTRPDTNYGYIQADGLPKEGEPIRVKTFTEKPDLALAKVFVQSGEFLWNSGIFIWRASTIKAEIERYLPRIANQFNGWEGALGTAAEAEFMEKVYSDIQKISIDYGIMERTENAWTFPAGIGWHDIGTWESLYSFFPGKDQDGNAVSAGAAMLQNSRNNTIISTDKDKLMAVCDLDGYVVVNTDKVLLVCPRDDRKIREFTSNLLLSDFDKYR